LGDKRNLKEKRGNVIKTTDFFAVSALLKKSGVDSEATNRQGLPR
jgi:hypothetical protein